MKKRTPLSAVINKVKTKYEAKQKKLKASLKKEVEQIYKRNKKRPISADNAKSNDLSYHLFAQALEKIGTPSDTQKVAKRVLRSNTNARKLNERDPKHFMQLMYSSASYLVEQGLLRRKKLGHNYFEYSLKSWRKKSTPVKIVKRSRRIAA